MIDKMKFSHFIILILICFSGNSFSQEKINFLFIPVLNGFVIEEGKYYKLNDNDSLRITALKFYISGIELVRAQKTWKEKNSYHLVDLSNPPSLKIELNSSLTNFTGLKFNLGIDSLTNVSGAMGGALDPTNGMYWTWQSGYINFKVEGNSNLCRSRKNEFQFHLGGYQTPFYCLQQIQLTCGGKEIKMIMDLGKIIDVNALKEKDHIMSPCKEAVLMAEKTAKHIYINKD
jgi:hypothetical protein